MRNLALACAAAAPRSKRLQRDQAPEIVRRDWALLVMHVGGHPHAEAHRRELDRFRELLLDDVRDRVAIVTYEDALPILRQFNLHALAEDVERRMATAG